ncbi:UvrD-helicase domain-containing protein [Collinsella sp. AGMB00827]|uniref:DNA 3'-5' helicase n=1 Tax=Collinsella ureilytica TaxID=2869515 RepID=A0ABS7MJR8_9ACTN|nr:UvrD-helicase domain-containing protein [Collinsella urealyticum]MBY4797522.1 UvrD-helicase domain-containing protein [Collinsella urealyticum]
MAAAFDIDSLNPAQREAVLTTEGPLLVLAGAGSGKTRVLTHRIAHIVADKGVAPWRILAITFTNKAAAEMRERLTDLLPEGTRGMWVCTFHAMCVRILREDADLLGYTSQFTIYDDDDSRRLVRDIMGALDLDQKTYPINMIRGKISAAKNAMVSPEAMLELAENDTSRAAARVYIQLERRLRAANAMDFDDLLVRALELLRTRPEVLESYQERFRYISVDEYQDTNRVQYLLANLLANKYGNLMVVGDDDQSIYSWRGADISNILDFEKDHPSARVIKLEQNYRSTGHILSAANAVVRNNSQRKSKRLFTAAGDGELIRAYQAADERDEGRWIASEIDRLHDAGMSYEDIAVFYRTNAQSRILEDMFLRAGVPYRIVGGTRFFDRAEIRDVMAYLKMVVNPSDEMSVKRVINTPRRGIGSASIAKIEDLALENHCSFFHACEIAVAETGRFTPKVRRALDTFVDIVRSGRRMNGELFQVVDAIVSASGLMDALRAEGSMEAEGRIENIQEFLGVAAEFEETHEDIEGTLESLAELRSAGIADIPSQVATKKAMDSGDVASGLTVAFKEERVAGVKPGDVAFEPSSSEAASHPGAQRASEIEQAYGPLSCAALPALMEWLALRSDLDALAGGSSAITMMTVHSSKGLEFPAVFVAGLEEGIFPHVGGFGATPDEPGKLEEERRLAYVAITRARQRLFLTYAATRRTYGSTQANPRSRFIGEIPEADIEITGVGSSGFGGVGWEKRGDRRGTFGSGTGAEYGGSVFGSYTRSSGGARRHREIAPDAGLPPATFGSGRSVTSTRVPEQRRPDAARAAEVFAVGDRVNHKTFGPGSVIAVDGDLLEVSFERSGQTKKLMIGFAPIVRLD